MEPEKEARYRAYEKVISSFGTPTQSMFVTDSDNEVDTFQKDLNEFLVKTGRMDANSDELPYHLVRIGYDGDMLDDLFRLAISDEAGNFEPAGLDAATLSSKQSIFQHLYRCVTKDKFLVIHITEFPLLYFFELTTSPDMNLRAGESNSSELDETIHRYLNDLRLQGSEEHRKAYHLFYRISTSLLMELSNAFLVVPTVGMNRHLVVTSWRTQTLLFGFSPLTWSSGSFSVYNLSGRDIDARWAYPARPSVDHRVKRVSRPQSKWVFEFKQFFDRIDQAVQSGYPQELIIPVAKRTVRAMVTRYLMEIPLPTQAINSLLVGLMYGIPGAQSELMRLLAKCSVPVDIVIRILALFRGLMR